jgi:hypothetical protein
MNQSGGPEFSHSGSPQGAAWIIGRMEALPMKQTRIAGTALLLLVVGASGMAQAQKGEGKRHGRDAAVPRAEQDQRIRDQQQRDAQYRAQLDQRVLIAQQQNAQLDQQRRAAQYRAQQQYAEQLRLQQQQLRATRNYSTDPYYSTAPSYRYIVGGNTRTTNQYGADVLKQAVNYGYQQGQQAGQADRQDHWAANYRNSLAYQDANYGYTGNYVNQSDYNYYFRQGFRRGYDDGYYSRSQYGTSSNGSQSILSSLLSNILGLTQLR